MVEYEINRNGINFTKRMGIEDTIGYIEKLNESSKTVHNGIGTLCLPRIEGVINQSGDFILGLIPSEVLPFHPSKDRKKKLKNCFVNLSI